ncbi:MAG: DNA topoisomerase VI subunit B, partial [Candidatus Kariarchaeaceae archaeon]
MDTNDTEPVEDIETPDSPKRDSKARTASAAVFFNENKSIAGFGNSMRAVFTSVRELVENSLDASEKRAVTPEIKINLRRLEKSELVALMGTNVVKDKDKRVEFIELSCRDNGVGVPRDLIPQLFGTVLAGTKYGAQQTRGRFGLGSKMVLLYAMSTLDLPIQITTRPEGENVTYRVQLFINLEKNAPILHKDEQFGPDDEEYFNDYGTEIKVSFTGSWNLAKLYVREYFRQLAIITPYADMIVDLPSDEDEDGYNFYQRVVDDLPKPPEVVRIHPWGTDISTFRREMEHATESNLIDFLVNNFMGVDEAAAEAFFQEVGVETDKRPQELTSPEIRRIVHDGFNRALKESKVINRKRDRVFKFNEPKGDALSPLGAERLRKGLQKELNPEFVESITRSPKAYEGHPFIIEAAIGYGGGVNSAAQSKGVTIVDNRVIYRFANRIPLIFGAGSDLITQIVNSINWSNYGLTRGTEPLAIAVSLVSTKIPFPETSKEYIDKVEEIGSEVRLTLLQLAKKLKTFLGRRRRRQRERRRKSRFERYAPRTVFNLLEILRKEELWDPSTGVNADRIISALSSGNPRIDSQYLPLGTQVFQAPMWATTKTQEKLQNEGIFEIASFLRHSNKDLAKILKKKTGDIDIIKRRTIAELDKAGQIPGLEIDVVLNPEHEVRFHRRDEKEKLIELPRLSKACNRRWIRNAYDYMVSTADQLKKVQGLAIKLAEAERVKIIENMFVEVDDVDLADELSSLLGEGGLLGDFEGEIDKFTQDELPAEVVEETSGHQTEVAQDTGNGEPTISINQLLPPMEEFYHHEKLKVRKVSTILEFLLETTHPSSPIDEKVLATILISTFVDHLRLLVAQNADYGKIKVSVPGQPWIDGYLRNAFKRRNINTVNDIIGFEVPKLAEIGELQRTLFNGILETLIPKNGQISPDDLRIENAEMKLLLLEQAEITSLEKLAATPSIDFAENPVLAPYVDMLIEESKDRIVEFLTMNNMIGPLNLLKELTPELEQELYELQISDSMELLVTPLNEFSKKHQGVIKQAKLSQGTGFTGFYKKQQKLMETIGVTVLEELVYRPNTFLNGELTETQSDEIKALIELLHEPSILFSSNVINSLDLLQNSGVNTLGKFLIWPAERLAQIIDMPDEWINIMRDSFEIKDIKASREQYHPSLTSVSNILTSQEISSIQGLGIDSVIEATSIMWGEDYPEIDGKWDSIRSISSLLTTDLSRILPDVATKKKARSNLTSAISDLEKEGIYTLLQFLRTPPTSLVQKMNSKAKRDIVSTISQEFRSHSPDVISPDSVYHKAAFTYLSIEKLRSPIASLSGFNIRDIGLLSDNGIKSIHQIITLPNSEIAQMLGTTAKIVEQKISDSSFNPTGTPLSIADKKGNLSSVIEFVREGNNYFQRDEINELINSGYNTIEALYYMSDHRTFDVRGVSWEIIHHFKKLMESPPVLITWRKIVKERREIKVDSEDNEALLFSDQITEEETPKEKQYEEVEVEHYETFSSQELEILTRSNISRVMDFLTTPGETISDLLAWDSKLTSQRQSSVILQEAGIELSDLEIFRDDHIELLKDLGIITIEDLYFTTREETWESPSIPFTVIQTVKNILHLPLEHVKTELGEDIYDLLIENDVLTILEFILTGDPILEQKTGLPAERFENLKYALDFGALIESFDKTIMFTPNLAFNDCKLLRNSGIERILDLVLADPKDIAKTLSVQKKEVDLIIKGVNRENIIQTEEDRGVLLSSLNAFSRSDIRSISRSGMFEMNPMDTVQEILYQVNDDNFHGEQYLLEYVKNLQIVCDLKLSQIGDLNDTDVELLKKVGVITISDAILVTYEDLGEVSHDLDVVLTAVTKSVMDMQSFIAMGKLPAQSAMSSGEDEDSLLNVWLNEPEKLDTRTMNNVRSILSLPIRLTSFAKQFPTISEDKLDLSLSEAILLYVPDEEDELHQIQSALETPGILINLLQEGSTPLTLLELSAVEFRALLNNGINTVERIMMNDPKTLSAISGTTQKYWREIKELFDPEMFKARLGDIGLPASIIDLSKEELAVLEEFNIEYLDQVTIYDEPEGIIESLQKFLYGSLSYLSGTPGEKEMAMNSGAISILEASISLKRQGADASVIYDMVSLGWQAFNKYTLPSPSKSKKNDVQTLQELCLQYLINPDTLTKNQVASAELFMKSPLLLPLPRTDLEDIVIEKRCTSILDALTNPLVGGPINTLRETLIEGGSIDILEDAELQPTVIEKISKTIWNRVKETSLSLQDIVSSPRTIESISGIKQRYLGEARDVLRVPLSQLIISDQAIQDHLSSSMYNRLIDLVFDLPALKLSGDSTFTTLVSFLTEGNFSVANDYDLDEELQLAIQTVFGMSISGFHDFWAMTLEESDLLSKIETPPAVKVKDLVNVASSPIYNLKGVTPSEIWEMYLLEIYTISDLIISNKIELSSSTVFTKKRVSELKDIAMKSLRVTSGEPSITIMDLCDAFGHTTKRDIGLDISLLKHKSPHPLIAKELKNVPKKLRDLLTLPVLHTRFGQSLKTEEMDLLCKIGIYSVLDWLVYPEKLTTLPKKFKMQRARLEGIQDKLDELSILTVSDLQLPSIVKEKYQGSTSILQVIFEALHRNERTVLKSLTIPLSYSDLDEQFLQDLSNARINSAFELLHFAPEILGLKLAMPEPKIRKLLLNVDFGSMVQDLENAPLQIKDTESLSKGGIDILINAEIFTALDLYAPLPDGLNRIDQGYLEGLLHILNA